MHGPLEGLRVIDLTQVLSGPFCTMLLADLGADVVKVEPPTGDVARQWGPHLSQPTGQAQETGADYGGYFASVNRNKRSVCIDLKSERGREQLLGLLADADVLVENFRVGVMERLGLSYEELHARFPRLVYAAIRGFGDPRTGESPYAHWPAFDIIAQAMGGVMSVTGADAAHPMKVGPGVGDIFPAVISAVGILAAVRHAERSGAGQFVDVAMYDAVLAMTERIVYQHSITGEVPVPQGNTHPLLCPYGVVSTSDGFVTIAGPSDRHWRILAEIIGAPEMADDPRYSTNVARGVSASEVYAAIERWSTARTTADVIEALAGRVPCSPVNDAAAIADDPHVAVRDLIVAVDHPSGSTINVVGTPIKMTETPTSTFVRAPRLGEHDAELLGATDPPADPYDPVTGPQKESTDDLS